MWYDPRENNCVCYLICKTQVVDNCKQWNERKIGKKNIKIYILIFFFADVTSLVARFRWKFEDFLWIIKAHKFSILSFFSLKTTPTTNLYFQILHLFFFYIFKAKNCFVFLHRFTKTELTKKELLERSSHSKKKYK